MASMAAQQGYPYWPTGPNLNRQKNGSAPAPSPLPRASCPPRLNSGSYQKTHAAADVPAANDLAAGAGRAALRALQRMTRDSRLFRDDKEQTGSVGGAPPPDSSDEAYCSGIARIDPTDLVVGRMLGRGGFSEVREARLAPSCAHAAAKNTTAAEAGGDEQQQQPKATTTSDKSQRRYAVKYLRPSIMRDKKKFERGAADLAIEAKLLSALDHPNIITLMGITSGPISDNIAAGRECGFFLVLDRLLGTLDDRIAAWKERQAKTSGLLYRATHAGESLLLGRGSGGGGTRLSKPRRALLAERLRVALDLAGAVRYLHERNVAYRDIKPENVGFDGTGELKLFDFGLAKEVKPNRRYADGTYRLTGNTGSRRYMAPEVALARPYNLSVDAYSFGILLWEMLALEKPFTGYSEAKHMTRVVEGGQRPYIDEGGAHSYWPEVVHHIIEACWEADWRERPTFVHIIDVLKTCVDEDVSKHRRRSLRSPRSRSPRPGGSQRIGSFVYLAGEAA